MPKSPKDEPREAQDDTRRPSVITIVSISGRAKLPEAAIIKRVGAMSWTLLGSPEGVLAALGRNRGLTSESQLGLPHLPGPVAT